MDLLVPSGALAKLMWMPEEQDCLVVRKKLIWSWKWVKIKRKCKIKYPAECKTQSFWSTWSILGCKINNNSSKDHYIWVNFAWIIFHSILALGKLVNHISQYTISWSCWDTENVLTLGKSVFGFKEEKPIQLTWEKRKFQGVTYMESKKMLSH